MKKAAALLATLLLALVAQDMWDERGEIFTDQKTWAPGTPVTLVFDGDLVANYQAALSRSRQRTAQTPAVASELFQFFPQGGVKDAGNEALQSKAQSAPAFKGTLSGTLVAWEPASQTYRFSATRSVTLNGRSDSIVISGTLHRLDVGRDRTVSSKRLANPTLDWSGFRLTKGRTFTAGDFTNLVFASPTNQSNAGPRISEARQRELFLEMFNQILGELF